MNALFYNTIHIAYVSKEKILKAYQFAEKVISTVNYSDSNQSVLQKVKDDHFVSKIGEEAAAQVLSQYGKVSMPDYNIYEGVKKSWLHDLEIEGMAIAVKTQRRTAALRYGLSWTFQCNDNRKDTILQKPDAWVIFVEYNDQKPYECKVFPPYQMKELVFKAPKLAHLKNSKKVVYADTLPMLK